MGEGMEQLSESGTINRNTRSKMDEWAVEEETEAVRDARLAAAKAEGRTGIAGAEEFEPLVPMPRDEELTKPWDPSMGRAKTGPESLDHLVGLPRPIPHPNFSHLSRPAPTGIPGEWHDSMLIAGWEYNETADAQVYRKPKQRPRYGGMR